MIIAASALGGYLRADMLLPCNHANGAMWKMLTAAEIRILAEKLLVTGKGTRSRLKYLELAISSDKAEDEIDTAVRQGAIRGRLEHSQASQTCVRHTTYLLRALYRHTRTYAFAPALCGFLRRADCVGAKSSLGQPSTGQSPQR